MRTPAAALRGKRPHREQAEENYQGNPGTVTVKRAPSLMGPRRLAPVRLTAVFADQVVLKWRGAIHDGVCKFLWFLACHVSRSSSNRSFHHPRTSSFGTRHAIPRRPPLGTHLSGVVRAGKVVGVGDLSPRCPARYRRHRELARSSMSVDPDDLD
jgi:hypothetical protein